MDRETAIRIAIEAGVFESIPVPQIIPLERFAAAVEANCVPQWQPIETAPKIGAHLAFELNSEIGRRPYVIVWLDADHPDADGAGWYEHWNFDPVEPTHWMPLPSSPVPKEES